MELGGGARRTGETVPPRAGRHADIPAAALADRTVRRASGDDGIYWRILLDIDRPISRVRPSSSSVLPEISRHSSPAASSPRDVRPDRPAVDFPSPRPAIIHRSSVRSPPSFGLKTIQKLAVEA